VNEDGASGSFFNWLTDRKNNRLIHHRMAECGYVPVRYKHRNDGYWSIGSNRYVIYARMSLTVPERYKAAEALVEAAKADITRGTNRPGGRDSIWAAKSFKVQA
jgi:hypothetical protein